MSKFFSKAQIAKARTLVENAIKAVKADIANLTIIPSVITVEIVDSNSGESYSVFNLSDLIFHSSDGVSYSFSCLYDSVEDCHDEGGQPVLVFKGHIPVNHSEESLEEYVVWDDKPFSVDFIEELGEPNYGEENNPADDILAQVGNCLTSNPWKK